MTLATYASKARLLCEKQEAEIMSSSSTGILAKMKIRRSNMTLSIVEGFTMITVSRTVASRKKLKAKVPKSGVWPLAIADEDGGLDLGKQIKELRSRIELIVKS